MLGALVNALTFGAVDASYDLRSREATEFLSGGRAGSGERVNASTALTVSAWYRAIDLLSDAPAKSPCNVYRLTDDGKEVDTAHPWSAALRRKPGVYQTPYAFFKLLTSWAKSGGNGYAFIDRDAVQFTPIDPCRMKPEIRGGLLWYVLDSTKLYNPDDILHFKGFSGDGLSGFSVVDKARESLGLSLGARKHQAKTLGNSARPSVTLETPNRMSKVQRDQLKTEWDGAHKGGDNAGKTAVLDNGLKASPYQFSSADIQLMETVRFTVLDISNFTGVPAHKLGDQGRAGYNSLESENLSFLGDTLEGMLVNIEQELNDKLLTEEEKRNETHAIRFDRKALSIASSQDKATYWRTALGGNPWATVGEARHDTDLNRKDDTDQIPVPKNMGVGGEQNQPNDPTGNFPKGASASLQNATATAIADALQRWTRKLNNQAKAKSQNPKSFVEWVDSMVADNREAIAKEFAALEQGFCEAHQIPNAAYGQTLLEVMHDRFAAIAETTPANALPVKIAAMIATECRVIADANGIRYERGER